jgi:CRISPR-associated exonuclease Cas4
LHGIGGVMEYTEDKYLLLSGIQHFAFCRRQWALIHIEQQWMENVRTFEGKVMHEKAHDVEFSEKRGGVLTVRGMKVASRMLGISGECDVVEFHKSMEGIPIHGREGLFQVIPIEYKRGAPKQHDADRLQLAAQAMCLEEMLFADIRQGYLYYGETRRRVEVLVDEEIRKNVRNMLSEMHMYYERGHTPKVKTGKFCAQCSLREICMPVLCENRSAARYIDNVLKEDVH